MLRQTVHLAGLNHAKPPYRKRGGKVASFFTGYGKRKLDTRFSFYRISNRIKNLNVESQNELWISRPYLSREEHTFMNTGTYVPKEENISRADFEGEDTVKDDFGNYIKKDKQMKVKVPKNLIPKMYLDQKADYAKIKELEYKAFVKPDVRGPDLWRTMEKYKTCDREDEGSLDFYRQYHNLAVPKKYPLSMPPAIDKWEAWEKVEGFQRGDSESNYSKHSDAIPHPLAYDNELTTESYESSEDVARHPFESKLVEKWLNPSVNKQQMDQMDSPVKAENIPPKEFTELATEYTKIDK